MNAAPEEAATLPEVPEEFRSVFVQHCPDTFRFNYDFIRNSIEASLVSADYTDCLRALQAFICTVNRILENISNDLMQIRDPVTFLQFLKEEATRIKNQLGQVQNEDVVKAVEILEGLVEYLCQTVLEKRRHAAFGENSQITTGIRELMKQSP